jgi:phosphoribosylformimino-5-aminoimidazole carboxamide ribotide isomerase
MLVIPAIDFSRGRLARLSGGSVVPMEAFGADPMAAARSFVAQGATWLHAVDLDLALEGHPARVGTFRELASLGAAVQASGGIRTREVVGTMLTAGAKRVVLGSAALVDLAMVEDLINWLGDQLAVGLEVMDGRLQPRGAPIEGELPSLDDALGWLAGRGASRVVLTAVGSVGELKGPDEDALGSVLASGIPVVVAGGVASAEDLTLLASLDPCPEAVIVGRALYEGGLSLSDASRAAAG